MLDEVFQLLITPVGVLFFFCVIGLVFVHDADSSLCEAPRFSLIMNKHFYTGD